MKNFKRCASTKYSINNCTSIATNSFVTEKTTIEILLAQRALAGLALAAASKPNWGARQSTHSAEPRVRPIRIAGAIKGPGGSGVPAICAAVSHESSSGGGGGGATTTTPADLSPRIAWPRCTAACGAGCCVCANENTSQDKAGLPRCPHDEPRACEQQMELAVYVGPPLYGAGLLRARALSTVA